MPSPIVPTPTAVTTTTTAAGGRGREQRTHDALDAAAAATDPQLAAWWRARAVNENYGLACSLARRYAGRGVELADLQQVAALGLVLAVHRYQPGDDRRFTAYAVSTITGELKRYFRDRTWVVRPPRPLYETYQQVMQATSELQQSGGAMPTTGDVADRLGITADLVAQAQGVKALFTAAPVDTVRFTPEGERRYEPSAPDVMEGVATTVSVRVAVATLPAQDQLLVRLRFEQGLSQAEIAPVLGVSQMQVSRRLSAVLGRLRTYLGEDFLDMAA